MKSDDILPALETAEAEARGWIKRGWDAFGTLPRSTQWVIAAVVAVVLLGLLSRCSRAPEIYMTQSDAEAMIRSQVAKARTEIKASATPKVAFDALQADVRKAENRITALESKTSVRKSSKSTR